MWWGKRFTRFTDTYADINLVSKGFQITTFSEFDKLIKPNPSFGRVVYLDGAPVTDGFVISYLTTDPKNIKKGTFTYPLSSLLNKEGAYYVELANARRWGTGAPIEAGDWPIVYQAIEVYDKNGFAYGTVVSLDKNAPISDIELAYTADGKISKAVKVSVGEGNNRISLLNINPLEKFVRERVRDMNIEIRAIDTCKYNEIYRKPNRELWIRQCNGGIKADGSCGWVPQIDPQCVDKRPANESEKAVAEQSQQTKKSCTGRTRLNGCLIEFKGVINPVTRVCSYDPNAGVDSKIIKCDDDRIGKECYKEKKCGWRDNRGYPVVATTKGRFERDGTGKIYCEAPEPKCPPTPTPTPKPSVSKGSTASHTATRGKQTPTPPGSTNGYVSCREALSLAKAENRLAVVKNSCSSTQEEIMKCQSGSKVKSICVPKPIPVRPSRTPTPQRTPSASPTPTARIIAEEYGEEDHGHQEVAGGKKMLRCESYRREGFTIYSPTAADYLMESGFTCTSCTEGGASRLACKRKWSKDTTPGAKNIPSGTPTLVPSPTTVPEPTLSGTPTITPLPRCKIEYLQLQNDTKVLEGLGIHCTPSRCLDGRQIKSYCSKQSIEKILATESFTKDKNKICVVGWGADRTGKVEVKFSSFFGKYYYCPNGKFVDYWKKTGYSFQEMKEALNATSWLENHVQGWNKDEVCKGNLIFYNSEQDNPAFVCEPRVIMQELQKNEGKIHGLIKLRVENAELVGFGYYYCDGSIVRKEIKNRPDQFYCCKNKDCSSLQPLHVVEGPFWYKDSYGYDYPYYKVQRTVATTHEGWPIYTTRGNACSPGENIRAAGGAGLEACVAYKDSTVMQFWRCSSPQSCSIGGNTSRDVQQGNRAEKPVNTAAQPVSRNSSLIHFFPLTYASGKKLSYTRDGLLIPDKDGNYTFTYKGRTYKVRLYSGVKNRIYLDENKNNRKDPGEKFLDELTSVTTLNLKQESIIFKYRLQPGYNFVHFPFAFVDNKLTKASNLLSYLRERANISLISYYDGQWHTIDKFGVVDDVSPGYTQKGDFAIIPGRGYVVRSLETVPVVIEIEGKPLGEVLPVYFYRGWNLVGFYHPAKTYTAGSLIAAINRFGKVHVVNVTKWDSGRYNGIQKQQGKTYGFDFPIFWQEAYFVNVDRIAKGEKVVTWKDQ